MASFGTVKSYTFPQGGLRATNAYGPTQQKQGYGSLASLLNGGLRGTDASGPLTPGTFQTNVNAGSSANPSQQAQQQVAQGSSFNPPTPNDLATDPILQQIRAAGEQSVADARQGALAGAENDLIGYGGTDIPQSLRDLFASDPTNPILAAMTDANTAAAAAANPDSTLKQLANTDTRNNAGIDQSNSHCRSLLTSIASEEPARLSSAAMTGLEPMRSKE